MILDITIRADSDSLSDMTALAALIASLGDRLNPVATPKPMRGATSRAVHLDDLAEAILPPGHADLADTQSLADDHSDQDAEIVDAAVAAGAPKVDSKGIPWDERIHSESRATIADGTWRKRRNVPDATYEAVMAELSGGNDAPPPPVDDTPAPPAEVPNAPTSTTEPEPAVTAPAADAATSAADMTFPQFVQAVQNAYVPASNKTYVKLNELAGMIGVAAFKDMKDHADKFEMFLGMLG